MVGTGTRRANENSLPVGGRPRTTQGRAAARTPLPTHPDPCPEVNCLRGLLPQQVIAAAERRARQIGLGADRVLICGNAITEEAYLRALATSLGTAYEPVDHFTRADCPLNDNELIQAAAAGLLPIREDGDIVWIVAPQNLMARNLAERRQHILQPLRLTSSERLWRFVARYTQKTLGQSATEGLDRARPLLSNTPRPFAPGKAYAAAAIALVVLTVFALDPIGAIEVLAALCSAIFLGAATVRLSSVFHTQEAARPPRRIPDDKLPIYTIICALYREATVVGDLIAAIRRLDYPIEKLDVKLVLEADDDETRRALALLDVGPPFEIITAPAVGPRTKPKALNVALPLARGLYTVVYDAEDVPEADQLRRAVSTFMSSDKRLACLQASLTIDNTADNWLARMFTANYAGQFDVFLPSLASLWLPFPLGGSSNHFRTEVLRTVGGWDPYNVTEDADLGIRLNRLGYGVEALQSSTYEEAPARFMPWLRQRTRWYKGWIQTWWVHTRRPIQFVRDLNLVRAAAFQLFFAGNVLSALVHPFAMAMLGYLLIARPPWAPAGVMLHGLPVLVLALLFAGYASTIALDVVGLRRRRLLAHAWVFIWTPLHWFLLSFAAWRALLQLAFDAQRWEKTEHGLARNSRRVTGRSAPAQRPENVAVLRPAVSPTAIMTSGNRRPRNGASSRGSL